MKDYLDWRVLVALKPGFILVDRMTARGTWRKGLVVALDLERYDFRQGSKSLIRATEGTVIERLPPRIKIRQTHPSNFPTSRCIDDPGRTVIEPLFEKDLDMVYDFDLMGGAVTSGVSGGRRRRGGPGRSGPPRWRLPMPMEEIPGGDENVMLYAMGDGNHSWRRQRRSGKASRRPRPTGRRS